MITVRCSVCHRDKIGDKFMDTSLVQGDRSGERISHGLCPHCFAISSLKFEIQVKRIIQILSDFVRCQAPEVHEAELWFREFEPELTNDGFVLKFTNGMELGMQEFMGTIFYRAHERCANYSGGIRDQKLARNIYDFVVDRLLAVPPM